MVSYWWSTSFRAYPQSGMNSEVLALSSTAAPGGGALLRADGEVVWTSPRPASEHLPAGISSIEVVAGRPLDDLLDNQLEAERRAPHSHHTRPRTPTHGEVTLRRVISNPSALHQVIAAFDRLPIVQPYVGTCPAEGDGPLAELLFRDRSGHRLARAEQRYGTEIGRCNPMHLRIGGRKQPRLAEGLTVIALVGRLVGVKVLPTSG